MCTRASHLAFTAPIPLSLPHSRGQSAICRARSTSIRALSTATMRTSNPARTAAITGASGGIGAETAKALVRNLPQLQHLYLLCRNVPKGEIIAEPLRRDSNVAVTVLPVELADARSVASCADGLLDALHGRPLDLLLCNAGIMAPPLGFTDNAAAGEFQRVERQYAVNHLSHALLTDRLLPSLREGDGGRVVFVSSMAIAISSRRKTPPLIEEKTAGTLNERNYSRWPAYGDSKLAMSLYAKALAEREGGRVESVSLHPGVVQTELARYLIPSWAGPIQPGSLTSRVFATFGFKTPEQGARLSVELACAGRGEVENGEMFYDVGGRKPPSSTVPLLSKKEAVDAVFEDTQKFVSAFAPSDVLS